jgi:heme exporter protein CcmD
MDWTAPHLGFVLSAYALTFVVLLGLAAYVIVRDRRLARDVASLERDRSHDG